jgi:putative endonuclease
MLASMSREHNYFVYILANRSRMLYIGVTNSLMRRVTQHREGVFDGFTKKYAIHRLVYFERFQYVGNAIAREKQLKGWLRSRKVALIEEANPSWEDLYLNLIDGGGKKQILRFAQDDKSRLSEGSVMVERVEIRA